MFCYIRKPRKGLHKQRMLYVMYEDYGFNKCYSKSKNAHTRTLYSV